MKRIITFIIMILFVIQISAQTKKNIFRTEIAPVFMNSRRINGFSVNNEYARQLTKNISLGLNIENKFIESKNIYSDTQNFGLNIYYTLNFFNFGQLQFGTGSYIPDFTKYTNFSSSTIVDYQSFNSPIYKINSIKYNSFVYTASFGLIIPLNNFISLSLRTVIRNDTIKKLSTSIKSGISVKF